MARRKRNRITQFEESAALNNALFDRYFDQLTQLAVTLPMWEDMPREVDTRYMEMSLYRTGAAVFFRDDVLGYMCLPVAPDGQFNEVGIPARRVAYGYNGFHYNLDILNSVIIYDNVLRKPLLPTMELMAYLMCDYDMTIRVNSTVQKTPAVLECEENERLTLENQFKEYVGNSVVIKGRKGISDTLKAIQPQAPFVGPQLYEMKTRYWNEALTILGVPNMIETRHQRQSADEVYRDMGGMLAAQYNRLYMRRKACEEINRMFGLNISVDYSVNISDLMQGAQAAGVELPDLGYGGNVSRETSGGEYDG